MKVSVKKSGNSKAIVGIENEHGKVEHSSTCLYFNHHFGDLCEVILTEDKYQLLENGNVLIDGIGINMQGFSAPMPQRPKNALFPNIPLRNESYNDGMESRERRIMAVVYSRNNIYLFEGYSIHSVVLVNHSNYTKKGKWSCTDYDLTIAAGYKWATKRQDWNSGEFVNRLDSLQVIAAELGIEDCSDAAIEYFLRLSMPKVWKRYSAYIAERESLYENGVESTIEYVFNAWAGTRRQGNKYLLIDGAVWCEKHNPMPDKVVVKSCKKDTYTLLIDASAILEELYEWNYGDDSLEKRGFLKDTSVSPYRWYIPKTPPRSEEENPFTFLKGKF